MIAFSLIRCLLIINVVHQGGKVFADFIADLGVKIAKPFVDVGNSMNLWWNYGMLKAEEAKLCKNGETEQCIQDVFKTPKRMSISKMDEIIKNPAFSPNKNLVFLIHGFTSSHQLGWVQRAKNALLEMNASVIALDYKSHGDYILLANNNGLIPLAEAIGEKLGKLIEILIKKGWSSSRIHVTGHSLGGHIAAFAGKYLKAVKLSLGRITALDPVGRNFDQQGPKRRLNKDDAEFVDCIYTNAGGMIGSWFPHCGANYFANCYGTAQPSVGIFKAPESHYRVTELFVESIYPNHVFEAKKCDEGVPCRDVKTKECLNHNGSIKMGYPASPKDLGYFYVETNGEYPYAQIVHSLIKHRRRNEPKPHNTKKPTKSKSQKQKTKKKKRLSKGKRRAR